MSTGKGRIMASVRKVESGRVSGKGRIRASAGKLEIWASTRNGRIRVSTGNVGSGRVLKRWDPGKMLENPKQTKRSKQTQGKGVGPSMKSMVCQQMTRISQKSNTIMTKEGRMHQYDNRKCHK